MRNVIALVALLALPLASYAGNDDIPFTFCGQAKKVVINGKVLTRTEVKRFENCDGGGRGGEPSFVISGYKNRSGTHNFNFVTENDVLTITITDEKGKLVTDW